MGWHAESTIACSRPVIPVTYDLKCSAGVPLFQLRRSTHRFFRGDGNEEKSLCSFALRSGRREFKTENGLRKADMAKRVADLLVDVLVDAEVQRVYGVSGDSLNGITDSIRTHRDMQWVHVRHEEVAAFAAGAEAHLTWQIACVCRQLRLGTCT
jgi:hypothetical protein